MSSIKQANYYDANRKKRLEKASETLVLGQDKISLLEKLAPYYTGHFPNLKSTLVGFLESDPRSVSRYAYYSIENPDNREELFSLVFLIENGLGQAFLSDYTGNKFFKEYISENPVMLFYLGCDDGSVIKIFPSTEAALEFLKTNPHFSTMMESQSLTSKKIKDLVKTQSEDEVRLAMDEKFIFFTN